MLRLILGIVSVLALAWWKRNIIQVFFEDWFSEEVVPTDKKPTSKTGKISPASSEAPEVLEDITVYVTSSGTRYHQAGCGSVTEDARSMPLSEARGQYKPCGICKPSA